jgi:hypothetical protein
VFFFCITAFTLVLQFDPIFNPQNDFLLLLLPLAWGSITGTILSFKPDRSVFTPKNIMLFVWLNKLVIIPLVILAMDNMIPVESYPHQEISTEIITSIVSFVAFALGWGLSPKTQVIRAVPTLTSLKKWTGIYFTIALFSLFWLYGSLNNYFSGAIFTYITLEIAEKNGTFWGFLANVGQRFWPFGVLLAWYKWKKNRGKIRWWKHVLWLLLGMVGTLSSNRSNMAYPLLMFLSVMCVHWRTRFAFLPASGALVLILLSFFFGYVRVQPSLDAEQTEILFSNYLEHDEYISYAYQIYFGSPYQITPLLYIHPPSFTLIASFLEPIPVIGKAFREQSGPSVYNLAYHNSFVSQDKVIPVAGELFYNGGYLLVTAGYAAFGIVYRWLDTAFKNCVVTNLPLAACFFYLALLFNATLLLSLSVLVQYALYNAAPALLLIAINCQQMRKAS